MISVAVARFDLFFFPLPAALVGYGSGSDNESSSSDDDDEDSSTPGDDSDEELARIIKAKKEAFDSKLRREADEMRQKAKAENDEKGKGERRDSRSVSASRSEKGKLVYVQ